MIIFYDTSALVKFFHEEMGTDIVTEQINNQENKIYISELSGLEFVSALYRRYRRGELDNELLNNALDAFADECNNFHVEPVNFLTIAEAKKLLLQYGKHHGLRTLDAIQLATFSLLRGENWLFVACDDVLLAVATAMDAQTINPLDKR